jgi:hypothetical protein
MSAMGHSRRFSDAPTISGVLQSTDIAGRRRQVGFVPLADISEMAVSVDVMGTFRADTTNRRCYLESIGEAPPDDEQPQP